MEGLCSELRVEAEAWSGPVAELDRAELGGVFVDPGAVEPEMTRELLSAEQMRGLWVRLVLCGRGRGRLVA